jgi:hypothetical protein
MEQGRRGPRWDGVNDWTRRAGNRLGRRRESKERETQTWFAGGARRKQLCEGATSSLASAKAPSMLCSSVLTALALPRVCSPSSLDQNTPSRRPSQTTSLSTLQPGLTSFLRFQQAQASGHPPLHFYRDRRRGHDFDWGGQGFQEPQEVPHRRDHGQQEAQEREARRLRAKTGLVVQHVSTSARRRKNGVDMMLLRRM